MDNTNNTNSMEDYFFSDEYGQKIAEIGKNNNLHIDQMDQLASRIRSFAWGGIEREYLAKDLCDYVEIEMPIANKIIEEVNEKIFIPLKQRMVDETSLQKESELEVAQSVKENSPYPTVSSSNTPPVSTEVADHIDTRLQTTETLVQKVENIPAPNSPKIPTNTEKKQSEEKYTVDPYREPIN